MSDDDMITSVPGFVRAPAPAPEPAEPAVQSSPPAPPRPPMAPPAPPTPPVSTEVLLEPVDAAGPQREPVAPAQPSAEDDIDLTRRVAPDSRMPLLRWDDGSVTPLGGTCVLGRDPAPPASGRAIAVPDESRSLSKTHLRIEQTDAGLTVCDLHSTNGVAVERDGDRAALEPERPMVVRHGDVLLMGRRKATVEVPV